VPERLTYTVPEIAELLGISRSSAYQCVRRGEIPALVLGRRVVVARAALEALLTNFADPDEVPASGGSDDRAN
jgi:excisionase family DNA binding protein